MDSRTQIVNKMLWGWELYCNAGGCYIESYKEERLTVALHVFFSLRRTRMIKVGNVFLGRYVLNHQDASVQGILAGV